MIHTARLYATAVLIGSALSGCSQGDESPEAQARQTEAELSALASNGSDIAQSGACAMFSRAEIAKAVGASVTEGAVWGLGGPASCEWRIDDVDNSVGIQVVEDTRYWERPSSDAETLAGLGQEAYVAPGYGGSFRAAALTEHAAVYVTTPRRDLSVELLGTAVSRLPMQ